MPRLLYRLTQSIPTPTKTNTSTPSHDQVVLFHQTAPRANLDDLRPPTLRAVAAALKAQTQFMPQSRVEPRILVAGILCESSCRDSDSDDRTTTDPHEARRSDRWAWRHATASSAMPGILNSTVPILVHFVPQPRGHSR